MKEGTSFFKMDICVICIIYYTIVVFNNVIISKISNLVYADIMLKLYANFHITAEPKIVALAGLYCFSCDDSTIYKISLNVLNKI